jgi:hypothetical protein
MIIGSYYLGKKAKKAYKNRQAEKAAKQLVGGVEVTDPSDELNLKAPPGSPIEKAISPNSVYSDSSAGLGEDHRNVSSTTPSSTYSSHGQWSALAERSDDFAQYQRRDLSNIYPQEPPSYDMAVHNSPAEIAPGLGHIAHLPTAHAHISKVQYSTLEDCPACIALLHQQHSPYHPPIHTHTLTPFHSTGASSQMGISGIPSGELAVAELPAQSVHERIAEMADTSAAAELPAELPATRSYESRRDQVGELDGESEPSQSQTTAVEMPTEMSFAAGEDKTRNSSGGDGSNVWRRASM